MNKFIDKLKSLLELVCSFFLPTILTIIPKSKKIWLLTSWSGLRFEDNSKAFYCYLSKEQRTIRPIYIVKCKKLNIQLRKENIDCYYYLSAYGIFYQIIASHIFFTHNIGADFCRPLISKSTCRVNLWHGMPIKKIRFDDLVTYSSLNIKIKSSEIYKYFSNEKYDYILSLGKKSTEILSSAFGHSPESFLEFGFPRNDILLRGETSSEYRRILYMPTFRNSIGSSIDIFSEFGILLKETNNKLEETNSKLFVKLHPANVLPEFIINEARNYKNIVISLGDASSLILESDVIITDYSSVAFDVSSSNKSLLLFCPDLDNYFSYQRSSYINMDTLKSEHYFSNWDECILAATSTSKDKQVAPSWLLDFHDYEKGKSCSNLYRHLISENFNGKV
ncbi:CDP-glycerol glycerophosphotransferase family protein [Vibrio sp. 10N.286.46.E10]|uniref:CDP-glycerol glycerophosphotransferase family protein n=1 Tax=unclassified Vibrio TaxID=2614977 RepID=UPI0015E73B70|nr:CDP-glycerol glycerophosphotransferase family protein [Vibrio sp. 10N.286.46.E10]